MNDIDQEVIAECLANAVMHAESGNDWGEGFWIGRAIEHADQNAVDHDWLVAEFKSRGLADGIIAEPRPGTPKANLN